MRTIPQFLFPFLFFIWVFCSAVKAEDFADAPVDTHSIMLYRWPLIASSPMPWTTVKYNPRIGKASLGTVDNSGEVGEDELVRVGVWDGKEGGRWFGSVVSEKILRKDPRLVLRLDEKGDVWHVEIRQGDSRTSTTSVAIVKASPETVPHLNKPIVLRPDGKTPEPEVQKTFIQKYWWLLLAGALLMLSGGGGAE